ncbi:hypothetical protein F0562_028893 [Nyssa sinensis]|uniref:Uncharacterized protein n=1 Tax=Nyssa sinensis TaxID=561372 RepID=A0A5J5AZF3_9ASTE|nr:hypothetical protein F0562_028893 [Nyssa sinensis]
MPKAQSWDSLCPLLYPFEGRRVGLNRLSRHHLGLVCQLVDSGLGSALPMGIPWLAMLGQCHIKGLSVDGTKPCNSLGACWHPYVHEECTVGTKVTLGASMGLDGSKDHLRYIVGTDTICGHVSLVKVNASA